MLDLIWQLPYIKAISVHHTENVDLIVREKTQAKNILKYMKHINKINYEFPSGIVEKKETTLQSAHKELTEETGYKSRSKLIKIITFYSEPGRLTTKITGYYTNCLLYTSPSPRD